MRKLILIVLGCLVVGGIVTVLFLKFNVKGPKSEIAKPVVTREQLSDQENQLKEYGRQRGQYLFQKGRYTSMIALYQKMLTNNPDNKSLKIKLSGTYLELAKLELENDKNADALSAAQQSLLFDPSNSEAKDLLAKIK